MHELNSDAAIFSSSGVSQSPFAPERIETAKIKVRTEMKTRRAGRPPRIAAFVTVVQTILFAGHWALYETVVWLFQLHQARELWAARILFGVLSISFVSASVLAFRSYHRITRIFYTVAAAWLGIFSFCLYAAAGVWLASTAAGAFGLSVPREWLALGFFGAAIAASVYGIVNASLTRVKRIRVKLPNLPESWRGRKAALVSDTHLGHVRSYGFIRKIIAMLAKLSPDVVFIAGDLYDGPKADIDGLARPWSDFHAPFGTYFVAGNHEQFSTDSKYFTALQRNGIRVLNNEKVTLDGLQLVGVHFRDSVRPEPFRSILSRAQIDPESASILLTHAPHLLNVPEAEGISLQLSGHTHRGQFVPYSWFVDRIYGKFAYGLQKFGRMLVYTSSGAGTWGPPLRVGTNPEIVLIEFD
jgi:uncharacterized protein